MYCFRLEFMQNFVCKTLIDSTAFRETRHKKMDASASQQLAFLKYGKKNTGPDLVTSFFLVSVGFHLRDANPPRRDFWGFAKPLGRSRKSLAKGEE